MLLAQSSLTQEPSARSPSRGDWVVSERGPHHRVHERQEIVDLGNGRTETLTHRYTELSTGLHYLDTSGIWQESKPEFTLTAKGYAVATRTPHKAVVAPVANAAQGALDLQMPDGRRMRSTLLGLALRDRVTGQSLLVAEVTESVGRQVAPNVILFDDVLDDVVADLKLTVEQNGIHQDVIIKETFDPQWLEARGFHPDTTRLEIWTEFFECPQPQVKRRVLEKVEDASLRRLMAEPEVIEDTLDFESMVMPLGRAYRMGAPRDRRTSAPMPKRWVRTEGRTFVVESIGLRELEALSEALPRTSRLERSGRRTRTAGWVPPEPVLTTPGTNSILLAEVSRVAATPGVVLDYNLVGALTNLTLQGDTTYYVNGTVTVYGDFTIEGGTVVKYNATNYSSIEVYADAVQCLTGPYRPAIFTSMHDNSVGTTIAGSTGTPFIDTAYNLSLVFHDGDLELHDLRMRFAYDPLTTVGGSLVLRDSQFVHNDYPFWFVNTDPCVLQNVLVAHTTDTVFWPEGTDVRAEHLTLHQAGSLWYTGWYSTLALTNSLFANVTNLNGNFVGSHNATNNSGTAFQTVGAGARYLAEDSPYRNAGTTNINPALRARLRTKTTFPPILLSNTVDYDVTLAPAAPRGASTPDLGYHYDPIDVLVGVFTVTNATLTVTNGAVIASFNETGIWLQDGAAMVSVGSPTQPNRFTRYSTVQELPVNFGSYGPSSGVSVNPYHYGVDGPSAMFRFSEFSSPAGGGYPFHHTQQWSFSDLLVQDCEFWNGYFDLSGPPAGTHATAVIHNNLFHRPQTLQAVAQSTLAVFSFSNNLVYASAMVRLRQPVGGVWHAHDNAFDGCTFPAGPGNNITNSHNAYINCSGALKPTNATSVVLAGFAYARGPLGGWYQPTNSPLLNAGSTTAANAGLYHYTVLTNQTKEAGSQVDIGYHYVAVDGNRLPLDGDGDAMPDYLEDANGNGVLDDGESDWTGDVDADYLPDWWELAHFGDLSQSDTDDTDGDSVSNLEEFLDNTDPNTTGFMVSFPSSYVRDPALSGSVSVSAGNPQRWIVLVDQEPSSAGPPSTWASCPPELAQGTAVPLAVNLINTEGWHTVWVGLSRASPLSQPTWARRRFKLDRTPPTLTITSPSPSATLTNPIAQVLGTCNEPLAGLTYDLEHEGTPVESGLPAFVTTQDESGASFQAYDVDLKEGTNTIIFYAEDLAGNISTATLPVELDTSTVVPVLNVLWPPEGETLVCADQCCILGMVHDPASWVRATITYEFGYAVTRYGFVDSARRFYIEGVPVSDGLSSITITATDTAGRVVTTERSLRRADYSATVTPDDLRMLETGIGVSVLKRNPQAPDTVGCSVNGEPLELDGVPNAWRKTLSIPRNESLWPLRVILTTASGPPSETMVLCEKPPCVRMGHFNQTENTYLNTAGCVSDYDWSVRWSDAAAVTGNMTEYLSCADPVYDGVANVQFPPLRLLMGNCWDWDTSFVDPLEQFIRVSGIDIPYTVPAGKDDGCWRLPYLHPTFWDAHLYAAGEGWTWTYDNDTDCSLILETGGRPGERIPIKLWLNLFRVEHEIWCHFPGWHWADADGVRLGDAGTTDSQGTLMLVVPGNAKIDVTPFLDKVRDRVTSKDPTSGEPFVAAEFKMGLEDPYDVTVDSDNNGVLEPDGLDDKLEHQVPGKVLMANQGDDDRDGLPNWADFHLDDPSKGFGTFADLTVRIPTGPGVENYRLRFLYEASDPTAIDFESDPLEPPAGRIRVWKPSTSLDRSTNYIVPGQSYSLAELGLSNPGGGETLPFLVEAVRPSTAMGDIAIRVEFSPSAGAPGTFALADEVRLTALGLQLVEAISDTEVVPRTAITDSHPAPYFTNLIVTVGQPTPSVPCGTNLVSTIRVQGQIRSSLCDLVPGDEGTLGGVDSIGELEDISISLNGEPLVEPNGTLTISKAPPEDPLPSFLKPFETYTDFDIEYTDVDVSTGLNFLRLAASDKVPEVGLTGFAELSFEVIGTYQTPGLTVAQQEALVQQAIPATLDFGTRVTSLAALTPSTAVQFQITIETNLLELTEEWTLPTTLLTNLYVVQETLTESAVLFTNGDAWVVVYGSSQLDSFLQGYGTYPDLVAQVSAPAMGLRDVVVRLRADGTSAGKLRHEYTSASVNFATNAMGDIESLALVARRVGVGATTNTLTRSGSSDTFTNAQTTVTFSVSVETTVAAGDPLPFTLTDSTLGLSAEPLTVQPGTEPLAYQTLDAPTSALPEGLDNPGYGAFWGWEFVNTVPALTISSEGGEIRVHYVRWEGPDGVLAEQAERFPQHFKLMSDGGYYAARQNPTHPLACECGCVTPEAHILVATSQRRELPQNFTLTDAGLQHLGFVAGLGAQLWDDVKGTVAFVIMDFQLARKRDRFIKAYIAMETGNATAPQLELVVDVGTKAEEVSAFIEGSWNLWLAAEQNQWDQLRAAASGDWEEYNRQSETMRWLSAYMVEFMVAMENEYAELNSFERGKIQGRITLEAVLIVLPFTKPVQAAQLSKVQFLTRLSEVGWIRENEQLLNILTRVIQLAEGKKPVPPIVGLTPPLSPAIPASAEVGGSFELVWGRMMAKIQQGVPRRQAAAEAMAELTANAGAGVVTLRFKQLQDLLLSRAPASFATEEEAFAFLSDLLSYNNWNTAKGGKNILVIVSDNGDGFLVLGGKAGTYEGHHILIKEMLEVLRDRYGVAVGDIDDTPVKIMLNTDHQYTPTSFHRTLDAWADGTFKRGDLKNIYLRPEYPTAASVLNEYLRFLKSNDAYSDLIPVVRAFAKIHSIPITE